MNALSTIAAAVTQLIASATLSQPPASVERAYVPPDYETRATSDLKLIVVGLEETVDLGGPNTTRQLCDHVYGLRVALIKRVIAADVTSQDALVELDGLSDVRQELIDLLKANRQMAEAELDTLVAPVVYDPKMLDQKKTFVSVISLTYRQLR